MLVSLVNYFSRSISLHSSVNCLFRSFFRLSARFTVFLVCHYTESIIVLSPFLHLNLVVIDRSLLNNNLLLIIPKYKFIFLKTRQKTERSKQRFVSLAKYRNYIIYIYIFTIFSIPRIFYINNVYHARSVHFPFFKSHK